MSWAQRLKRVFNIDIETCRECGGTVKVMPKALAALAGQALPASKTRRSLRRFSPICRERTHQFQRVCGRQVGRHRLTCLADTIKPFTPFQWQ